MAQVKGGETIVDAVIDKLKLGMEARVQQINAQVNDGILISPPGDDDYYRWGQDLITRTPAIIVTEGEGEYGEEGPHSFILTDEIPVYILDEDTDRNRLGAKLIRLQRAVIETIWDDQPREALTNAAFRIFPSRHIPGRVFEPDEDHSMWRAYRIVVFTAQRAEGD